jgi:hypothetical protein
VISSKIPYAMEQGIFAGLAGNFFARARKSREFAEQRKRCASGAKTNGGQCEADGEQPDNLLCLPECP